MDSKKVKKLLEKYWQGTTSIEEEQLIMREIASDSTKLTEEEKSYFSQLNAFKKLTLTEDFEKNLLSQIEADKPKKARLIPMYFWRVAASLVLAVSLFYLYSPNNTSIQTMTVDSLEKDPRKAYEVSKQALLLISRKLNKASEVTLTIDKFEETSAKIRK